MSIRMPFFDLPLLFSLVINNFRAELCFKRSEFGEEKSLAFYIGLLIKIFMVSWKRRKFCSLKFMFFTECPIRAPDLCSLHPFTINIICCLFTWNFLLFLRILFLLWLLYLIILSFDLLNCIRSLLPIMMGKYLLSTKFKVDTYVLFRARKGLIYVQHFQVKIYDFCYSLVSQ